MDDSGTALAGPPGATPRDTVEEAWDRGVIEEILSAGDGVDPDVFAARFMDEFGLTGRPVLTTSAREALRAYLAARRPARAGRTVLISAFNCDAVADAVRAAGLVPATFDAGATFGAMDPTAVEPLLVPGVTALVVPHLFGVPADLRPLLGRCRGNGIAVIEDCSQTVGARLDGHPVGGFGDAAIFSFGYDKPLSLGGGGLLVERDGTPVAARCGDGETDHRQLIELCRFLRRRRALIAGTGAVTDPHRRQRLLASSAAGPAPTPVGSLRAKLGIWQLDRYETIRRSRNANAELLADAGLVTWPVPSGAGAAWLKQKVLLSDGPTADRASRTLQSQGLRVGPFNWAATVPDSRPRPRAAMYARCSVDVPIHQRITSAQVELMAGAMRAAT